MSAAIKTCLAIKMLRLALMFCAAFLLGVDSLPMSNRPKRSVGKSNEDHHQPFFHPYVKQLYQRITYENGSLITDNLGDDPITIWSFLDIGKHFLHVVESYRT